MSEISQALAHWKARNPAYTKFDDYYRGKQPLNYASPVFADLFGERVGDLVDNLCPIVIDTSRDRLKVVRFAVEHLGGDSEQSAADTAARAVIVERAKRIWTENRMARRSGGVHKDALTSGDSYVMVWPSSKTGRPGLFPHKAGQMAVGYDGEEAGAILWAAKNWIGDDNAARVTVYLPDGWTRYRSKKDDGVLPDAKDLVVEEEGPNPYGRVPVFHFGNNADTGEFGVSELSDIIPMQDLLNKSIVDMVIAQEFYADPQRWLVGYDPNKDALDLVKHELWVFANENAKFGNFDANDPTVYTKTQQEIREEIARISGTPSHIMQLRSSGGATATEVHADSDRLVSKVTDRQTGLGDTWEDMMTFALSIEPDGIPEGLRLSCEWTDPAPLTLKERLEAAEIALRAGVPQRRVYIDYLGYSPEDADEMIAESALDADELAERRARSFNAGAMV